MSLILEVNENCVDKTDHIVATNKQGEQVGIMISPPTGEDYWSLRVKLHKKQAVVGFPKLGLIGVGFAQEKDWNLNLPLDTRQSAEQNAKRIAQHIKSNKKHKVITIEMIEKAIVLIFNGAIEYGFIK